MSRREDVTRLGVLLVTIVGLAACQPQPPAAIAAPAADAIAALPSLPPLGLGRRLSGPEIRRVSISVAPDGTGLPPGRGGVVQGSRVYAEQCAACHGAHGEGSADYPALVGGIGSLGGAKPVQTVGSLWPYATTVFDYIRRAMPYGAPGSLSADDTYAVTAWVLAENGVVGRDAVLGPDNLGKVRMPNRDGFVDDPRAERRPGY